MMADKTLAAYSVLFRLSQLHRLGTSAERCPDLVKRVNSLMSGRSGRHKLNVTYTRNTGIVIYTEDDQALPLGFAYIAHTIHVTDRIGNIIRTVKKIDPCPSPRPQT